MRPPTDAAAGDGPWAAGLRTLADRVPSLAADPEVQAALAHTVRYRDKGVEPVAGRVGVWHKAPGDCNTSAAAPPRT